MHSKVDNETCLVARIESVDCWKLFEPLEIVKLEDTSQGIILSFGEN